MSKGVFPGHRIWINGVFMNIIIVGCGKVGTTLASRLDEEGNDVTVIDIDSSKISAIGDSSDIMGIVGNGAIHKVQLEAGIREGILPITRKQDSCRRGSALP